MSPKSVANSSLAFHLASLGITPGAFERWSGLTLDEAIEESGKTLIDHLKAQSTTAAADGEILIYGLIVPHSKIEIYRRWFGDESVISNQLFREQLNEISGEVTLRVNSPGGDVWEASGMIQAVDERSRTSCIVDGLAASAASMIMVACEDVTMARMANVMIHRSWTCNCGNANDFRTLANLLEKVDRQAATLYAEKMGKKPEEVLEMLTDESWFTAQEAVEVGLADKVFKKSQQDDDDTQAQALAARNERFQKLTAIAIS